MKKTSYARLRRILAMIAALTILLSCLAACGKKPEETESTADSTPPTAATTEATQPTETTAPPETTPPSVWGTVNTNNLNIRTSPSSTSTILGQFDAGTRVEILEQQTTDGVNWGRLEQGWVNLLFVNLDSDKIEINVEDEKTETPTTEDKKTETITGTTTVNKSGTVTASELNIRKGPGTNYDAVGKYYKNDKVTITEVKGDWGKTSKGWVNMKYVNTTGSTSTNKTDKNDTTDPKYTTLVTDGSKTSKGKVKITIGALNVRYGPGSSYEVVKKVTNGTTHTYYQVKGDWVRIADGWIYTKGYTDMGESSSSGSSSGSTGTGTTTTGLNIRKEGNKNAEIVGSYKKGTKVTILEVKNGWGKTDKGWINLSYVKMDSTSSSDKTDKTEETEVGKNTTFKVGAATVVVNSKLTIRKEAKSDAEKVGSYNNGDKVNITEVSGEWGKTDKGWINLRYVKY